MILRPFRLLPLKGMTVFFMMVIMLQNVNSKPQDPAILENVASQAVVMADSVVSAAMFTKNMDIELPFVKAKSESKAGTGAALRNDDDEDSSEEDRRRKRSIDFQIKENTLLGKEFLQHQYHFHRDKRSPCHTNGGGDGGGTDGDEIDFERRLRAYARKRKAAAKSKKQSTNRRKKQFISDDDDDKQLLTRRKRQSEVDDLNQTTQNGANDYAKYAQQVAENIRRNFENFVTSMTDMAEKLRRHFSPQNATDTMKT